MVNKLIHHTKLINAKTYINNYCKPLEFVVYCKACNKFNKCWACPPFSYDPIQLLNKYKFTYVIGTQVILEAEDVEQTYDSKQQRELLDKVMFDVRQKIDPVLMKIEGNFKDTLALFAGTCHLCPELGCTRSLNKPCRYPNQIRPSLEAYGFDISKTTSELLGIDLKWGEKGKLPPYLILVSAIMCNEEIASDLDSEVMCIV